MRRRSLDGAEVVDRGRVCKVCWAELPGEAGRWGNSGPAEACEKGGDLTVGSGRAALTVGWREGMLGSTGQVLGCPGRLGLTR